MTPEQAARYDHDAIRDTHLLADVTKSLRHFASELLQAAEDVERASAELLAKQARSGKERSR